MKKRSKKSKPSRPPARYSTLDLMMASTTEPMPAEFRLHQLRVMHDGLNALQSAEAPTPDDWRVCSDAVNLMETMVELGWIEDNSGLLADAVQALGEAGERHMAGKALRLSGPGLAAVRAVLLDYEEVIGQMSERNVKTAFVKTERRVWEIIHGTRRPHDVTITSL